MFAAAPPCTEAPLPGPVAEEDSAKERTAVETKQQLCPYAAVGECRYGENCVYLHGDSCDMCGLQVLHPVDAAQRSQHIKVSLGEAVRHRAWAPFSLPQLCWFGGVNGYQ